MELHSLQEALKVEIQSHQKLLAQMKQDPQNCDLKKEIHEKQCRIAALNEKQKLAVRSCALAVGSAVKPGLHQSLAISLLPAKAPASMVTAHLNGQKEPAQSSSLQATNKLLLAAAAGRRAPEGAHTQTLGNLTSVPIKVPQISSLHRLSGHGPTVLPQVRPKSLIPDSLPISLCRDQPSKQPPTFQKATVVSVKNPSPALPTANNTVSHTPTHNGQSLNVAESAAISPALSSAGVAYAIISTSSNSATPVNTSTVSVVNDGIKVQPLLFSADNKLQTQPENNVEIKKEHARQPEDTTHITTVTKKKREENPEKIAFMVALGLVTTEHLEEIQSKRQERKRRSTANPAYSGLLEPERKRLASSYLYSPLFFSEKANEDLCWKEEITHDRHCSTCKRGSNLQPCSICPKAYHLNCVDPPLKSAPKGVWMCPKCQQKMFNKDNEDDDDDDDEPWSGAISISHSYVTHKTVREEEKRKLLKRGSELRSEHRQLQDKDQLLSDALKKCLEQKSRLLAQQKGTQSSLERLKNLIRLIQNEQMIQVTMTTTTTSSLLTVPWIKPSSASAAMHKALQQSQSNN
ncbi:PHD finger protein 21B isoform X2 [Pleurodeles waltl]|uniref:PHD finger protein 21B isoform X2 n=1 Tax=Pleurodeles waltl TaxID=8319 RepID=UPI00370971B2